MTVDGFQVGDNLEELVLGAGADIRAPRFDTGEFFYWMNLVEVPNGSSRYYFVLAVADQAKGFSNEYRTAAILPTYHLEGAYFAPNPHYPYAPSWTVPYP